MEAGIFVAVITGALSILGAALTYFLTKHKEREEERRKRKIESYKDLLSALANAQEPIAQHTSEEFAKIYKIQRNFYETCNKVNAVASESVVLAIDNYIRALNELATLLRSGVPVGIEEASVQGVKYSALVYAIRDELNEPSQLLKQANFVFTPWVADPRGFISDDPSNA